MKTNMKISKVSVAGMTALAVAVLAYVGLYRDNSASMTLLLRCDTGLTGTLTLANSLSSAKQTASADEVCRTGSMEINDYVRGAEVTVTYVTAKQDSAILTLAPEADIETSPDGYFSVVAIRKAKPFLSRDRL